MALRWTTTANRDLVRVHAYLQAVDAAAAARAVQMVVAEVRQLARHPRIGRRLPEFDPREVRRLLAGDYEIRYEVRELEIVVLRLWHVYEDR